MREFNITLRISTPNLGVDTFDEAFFEEYVAEELFMENTNRDGDIPAILIDYVISTLQSGFDYDDIGATIKDSKIEEIK